MSIHAPYNFVPLSAWIYKPDWGHLVSHDLPFSDGISGTLGIEITAETPLLVGGRQQKADETHAGQVRFYQTPDGTYAIPGSSLKGMIRNVLEIAAFGKMRAVDDRTLSVRDLTNGAKHIYRDHFLPNKELGKSGVLAGWLSQLQNKDGQVERRLRPCEFLPVDHSLLLAYGYIQGIASPEKIKERGVTSVQKYRAWGEQNLAIRFTKRYFSSRSGHQAAEVGSFHPAGTPGAGTVDGTLVFTGQPDNQKRREFVFYQPQAETQLLPEELVRAFLQVHGGDHYDPQMNATKEVWNYWQEKLRQGREVPVFYLKHGDRIHSLGLARMYRLAYRNSIAQTITHTNPGHLDDSKDDFQHFDPAKPLIADNRLYDLPELLFGTAHEKKTDYSLRSRVSFSTALVQGKAEVDGEISSKKVVLNNPKPTYYPNYVRQPDAVGEKLEHGKLYHSYMNADAEIRGWKRYPVRPLWQEFKVHTHQVKTRKKPPSGLKSIR